VRRGPDKQEQVRLEAAVRAILPAGYRITGTAARAAPPDWHANEPKTGFLVEGVGGGKAFRICFLPRDWVGIRKRPNDAPLTCYWEGILDGQRYKTIAAGDDAFQERARHLLGETWGTPSLVNGGYHSAMEVFRGRQEEATRAAQALVKKHCRTPEELAEAAHSLVVLGVPAKGVFLRAAREVPGRDKDFVCGALGLLGGADAIGALCAVVADASQADLTRKYVAVALDGHVDRRIGPALHKAVKELHNGEAVGGVARVLRHQRHAAAAPDLLAAMKRIDNDYCKAEVAQCLAAMRYARAIPAIRRLAADLRGRHKGGPGAEGVELALQRLTGDWGTAGKAMRVRLTAPAEVSAADKGPLRIDVENVGAEPFRSWNVPSGLTINGRAWPAGRYAGGGLGYLVWPGDVHTIAWDLAGELREPGTYRLRYEFADGCSNEVRIRVRAKR
jgi:hypothetical protein